MVATVHPGSIERMMECLCRIRVSPLGDVFRPHGAAYALDGKAEEPPHFGGVYAYWWTGAPELLAQMERRVIFHGPGGRDVEVVVDDEWLGLDARQPVPLYVGKTADSIRRRMGLHLRLGSIGRILPAGRGLKKAKAPTTSCQLRAGIERVFPRDDEPLRLIREHVGMSYVALDGDEHAANRFYLENLAIGRMRPLLNMDVER